MTTLVLVGDTRIRHGLLPTLRARETGWWIRNFAEPLNMGGDIITLVVTLNTLKPQERRRIKGLVLGLSGYVFDDADIHAMTLKEINRYTVDDQICLFGQSPKFFAA